MNQKKIFKGRHLLAAGLAVCGLVALGFSAVAAERRTREPAEAETVEVPLGLRPIFWPEDNPYSAEKADLGRLLYFDARLSSDGTVSCSSCHEPEHGFTDGRAVSTGIGGQQGGRSAPTVINRAYTLLQFWDGRAATLEDQVKGPLANPLEMTSEKSLNEAHESVVKRINGIPGYVKKFRSVFGDGDITIDHVAKAVATFERTVLSGNSPYDRYKAGDKSAMSESQIRGLNVFVKKAECDACHLGFNFSDESYMNIGIGMDRPEPDPGRYAITKDEDDFGAFKTPTLREVEHTAPYMHDGSIKTLEEVVEHYDKGGIPNPHLSEKMKPLKLTDQEKADLVAFMKALSGEGWQHLKEPASEEFPR